MNKKVDYGSQPMQMDDYGMDVRHYDRHGDCTISPTYGDEQLNNYIYGTETDKDSEEG